MLVRRLAPLAALVALLAAGCGEASRESPAQAEPASTAPSASAPVAESPSPSPSPVAPKEIAVPRGVTAGIVVFDRRTQAYAVNQNAAKKFRSASIVKLWIVLDLLWGKSPEAVPAADRTRLDVMLRGSDDKIAIDFWKRGGQRAVVSRMVSRLGLTGSAPPPAEQPGYWGYTVISTADIVRTYRYLLDEAPAPVREFVMGNLRLAYRCATDRYDQSFGIPSSVPKPFAVKQGWSGFGDNPAQPCTPGTAPAPGVPAAYVVPPANARANPPGLTDADMAGEVLHTTGTVGADDRVIVVVLSLHPDGTSYANATRTLTDLTRSLPIPGR
ncbi:hypothetical protein [Virgisporangium aliadipatigenens]|uniref:hypothetical protein n=1 Tax=Virgisporangium aliadipatigenens TaxID=741659 RepID=UPI001944876A|nr:hypothetical protein [Virgisporangium aliadipatigenens]